MKRHVQTTGVRNWSGDAFVELQREPLMALEAVLQDLGDCIVQGCQVSRREDGTYDVSSGYVALQGIDRGVMGDQSAQRILLMPFAGVQGVAMPMYIVPQETVVNRVYNDGSSKPIAYVWQAVYSASQPEAGGYVTLTAAGGRSWRDAMQDATHRMVSDTKINAWDAKADKSGTYPNMTVGHASAADTATSAASATQAIQATQDGEGNNISSTYLKRSGGTMTGNLALSNEVHVNGAAGNLIGRFTWAGGLKAVVGNSQDTIALLSKEAATLNGSPIITGNGGVISGNLVQKKGNCSIHTDVASYRMPDNHTGWIRIDFGLLGAELLGVIDLIIYGKGGISIDFSGYTYVDDSEPTKNNWYGPKYGIRGSLDAPMPTVCFAKDNTSGHRYIMIGGDSFKWGPYGFISLSKVVLGSLGNTTGDLGVSIEAVSGNYADLGVANASVSNPSVSIEVERARQATLADTLGEDAYTSSQVVGAKGALSSSEDEFPKDLSAIKTPGLYAITSNNTGQPSGYNYGVLCVFTAMKEGNNRTVQMFTSTKSREEGFVSRTFIRYQFDNLLNWAFTPWVELVDTYDLPAKATTQADGLMSKEDKASLDYLADTAGKPVILAEVTSIPDAAGQECTINSCTADGVTVSIIRAVTGFTVQHNLNSTDYFVAITPIDSFNYTVGKSPTSFGIATSTKWPFDANSRAWGRFSVAVFKYK